MTVADCVAFLKEMEKANVETQQLAGDQTIVMRDSSLGISFSYHDAMAIEEAAAAQVGGGFGGGGGGFGGAGGAHAPAGGAGFGGGVHTGILAK